MKRFRFRLERVLDLRKAEEREQARRLGEAHRHEAEQRRAAETTAAKLGEVVQQLESTPAELRTAGSLRNLTLTLDAAKASAASAEDAHREAAARVEAEEVQFARARQDRRAVERLREQRHEVWRQEVSRAEQHAVDEVALRQPRANGGGQ